MDCLLLHTLKQQESQIHLIKNNWMSIEKSQIMQPFLHLALTFSDLSYRNIIVMKYDKHILSST